MACEHDAAEMDTAAHWDGLCPLCMAAKIERLTAALTTTQAFIQGQQIAHALVPRGDGGPDTWPPLRQVIDEALGT